MALKFEITGDNSNLLRSLDGAKRGVRETALSIKADGKSIEDTFKQIAAVAGIAFSAQQAKEFAKSVMNIRGQFQQLEIAFTTMLQSEEKAMGLMNQLVETAAKTPFDLKGIADGAKQLLAYGIQADEINESLVRLGDIAAGLGVQLGDLVYLYGTTMVQGRMFTNDLRQFMGRGIPMAEELAKQFGVTKDKVQELVTAGRVGAEQVKKAIWDMTSEGSRFGGLMEKQSKSITGQISNIEDAVDTMLNEIGKNSESFINSSLSAVSFLIENYKSIGNAIMSVISIYGTYKGAVMAVIAVEKLQAVSRLAAIKQTTVLGLVTSGLTKKVAALNATMLANPYVLMATGIAALIAIMVSLDSEEDKVRKATEKYNKAKEEQIAKEEEHKRIVQELCSVIEDEASSTENRRTAMTKLMAQYPEVFAKYNTEIEALKDIAYWKREIANIDAKNSVTNVRNELESIGKRIAELEALGKTQYRQVTDATGYEYQQWAGGRTEQQNIELKSLRKRQSELKRKQQKQSAEDYMSNLTGISNTALEAEIRVRKSLIDKMKMDKNLKTGIVEGGGASGEYTRKELEAQLQRLEWERNRRNQPTKTPAQQKAELLKTLNDAKKALADFDKSTTKYTAEEAEKKRKELEAAVDKAEKAYKEFGGDVKSNSNGKEQQKYIELQEKLAIEQRRAQEDLELETRQAEINLMDESIEQVLEQYKLDFEKEKLAIERGYEDLKQAKINKARELFEANPANEGKVFDSNSVDTSYTKAEEINFNAKINANLKDYQEKVQEFAKTGSNYLHDFLKEFGTLEEKRYAIVMQYEGLISKAITENEKKKLRAERDRDLSTLKAQRLANEIDWSQTFKGIGGVLDGIAKETLKKVDEYMGTDEFKNLNSANKQAYSDLRDKLVEGGSLEAKNPFSTSTWSDIAKFADEYKQSVLGLIAANDAHKNAVNELIDAEKRLEEATEESEKARIRAEIDVAKWKVENTANGANEAEDKKNDAQKKLKDATEQASQGLTNFNTILGQITEGSLSGFATGIANVINQINGSGKKVSNAFSELAGKAGGIIGAILTIIDLLGDDPAGFFKDILDKIANLIDGLLSKAPEILMSIVSGIGNIIGAVIKGIGNSLTFGLLSRSNEEEMEKRIAELADVNKSLAERIDDLAETISKSSSTNQEAIDAYKVQMELEDEWLENQRESIKARAGEWTNSGYGFLKLCGKNSFLNHMESNSWEGWKRMSDVLKKVGYDTDVNRDNFFDLSPEALRILRDYASQDYAHILEGDGHKNPKDLVDQYIEHAGRYDELVDAFNEKMTGYNLEGFYDQYKKLLNDMKSDTKDFADSIEDLISNALLNAIVNEHFRDRIETLYKYISEAVQSDGLDENEINNIREENEKIVNDMLAEREALIKAGMIKTAEEYKQEVSSGGWQSMGQETAGELNGRFTALQISGEKISDGIASMVATLATLSALADGRNITLTEIRNLMITNNAYLEDILDANKKAYQKFEQQFDKIITQTK